MSSLSDVYRDVIPLPITVDSYKACSINDDTLLLRCHSFLSVFVTNVTYGRTASKVHQLVKHNLLQLVTLQGTELCDGDKPKDAFAPSQDCYDDSINKQLLETGRSECLGQYDCVTSVPTLPLTSECDGKRREMRVEYSCGEHGA